MFGLVFTLCAIAAPSHCEDHLRPLHGASEITCLTAGQAEIAAVLRPGWRVARFGCTRLDPPVEAETLPRVADTAIPD